MSDHKISANGLSIECHAEPDAWCRQRPDCDSETWNGDCCDDHTEQHLVVGGHDCWKIPWLNTGGLLDETYDGPGAPVTIYPGRGVLIDWHDGYCTWDYERGSTDA